MKALLAKVGIRNFLGIGPEEVTVAFDGKKGLLVGKNNSGKTAICEAIGALKKIGDQQLRTSTNARGFSAGWSSCGEITADYIHTGAEQAEICWWFFVPADELSKVPQLDYFAQTRGDESLIEIRMKFGFRPGTKKLLELAINGQDFYRSGKSTALFHRADDEDSYEYRSEAPIIDFVFSLHRILAGSVLFFPARRGLANTDTPSLDALAAGMGVGAWIKRTTNADPRQTDAAMRHRTLDQFEREFADFIGATNLRLSATDYNDLTLSIDGRLLPISKLGAGVGECLLMMLVSKISRTGDIVPSIIVVDEPELHLHPALQKQLIKSLVAGSAQMVCATHSSTLLGEAYRQNWVILKTTGLPNGVVTIADIDNHDQIREAHLELGIDPGELVQADGILWVEGVLDVSFYREMLRQIPGMKNRQIVVVPLGGGDASASEDIDLNELKSLNERQMVIFDSERAAEGAEPSIARKTLLQKCEASNIPCHLTVRRALENYFPAQAVSSVMPGSPSVGPFEEFKKKVGGYKPKHGRLILKEMKWSDIADTDIGIVVGKFATGA